MALETLHRPGPLKQKNKTHKTGRHRSKGCVDNDKKGRVNVKTVTKKAKSKIDKIGRRNKANQIRKKKREDVISSKRSHGSGQSPPLLTVVVSLTDGVDVSAAVKLLQDSDESSIIYTASPINQTSTISTLCSSKFKHRISFLTCDGNNLNSVLSAAMAADTVLFLYSAVNDVSTYSELCLSCLFSQGLPSAVHAIQGVSNIEIKKRNEVKKTLQKQYSKWFSKDRFFTLDNKSEAQVVLQHLMSQKQKTVRYRSNRPHLLAEQTAFEPDENNPTCGTLMVSGYLRGKPLSANSLVHLPGHGDCQIKMIEQLTDPSPINMKAKRSADNDMESSWVVDTADPSKQESLDSEVTPDPMEGEQTWPTEEEIMEAETRSKSATTKRVPKGTSAYQAAWIVESSDEGSDDESDPSDDESDPSEQPMSASDDPGDVEGSECGTAYDTMSIATDGDGARYDEKYDEEEDKLMLDKYREERTEMLFPDEIDTPVNGPARVRFAKYRGLKSFRTSPWNPRENLPNDYSRIYQFENFNRTKKKVLSEPPEAETKPGQFVRVHIANVPHHYLEKLNPDEILVLFGLLSHEQKMSVVHFALKRHPSNDEPVKSKENLVFFVGCRKFSAAPVFSQHTSGDKHKFERYLSHDATVIASVYSPLTFPPCPVLVFKPRPDGTMSLVATGTVYKVDPDRVVAKRVILSGHPFKINKKLVVLRYMFFNREDILWFKPIELKTKWGRKGYIREALGTHGHMKCIFDGQLKSQDTVLMHLYKRIYPKWSYNSDYQIQQINVPPSSVALSRRSRNSTSQCNDTDNMDE